MGCAIFFFVSGYTLALTEKKSFFKWIGKRFARIYPPVWIFYAVTGFTYPWYSWTFPHLWFLHAILIFYILFYFCSKYLSKFYLHIILVLTIFYILEYSFINHSFWMIDYAKHEYKIHWFYYFAFMLIGARVRENCEIKFEKRKNILIVASLVSVFAVYGFKFLCTKNNNLIDLQILFPVFLIIAVFAVFLMAKTIKLEGRRGKIIKWIANLTLELYIVQEWLISKVSILMPFPIRLFVVVFAILCSAFLLHWISNKMSTKLISLINSYD